MFEQLFESFRKASESSLRAQQEMFKQWSQQWPSPPLNTAGVSPEWSATFQKRWLEIATESLSKQRELIDSAYKAGIHVIEQAFRVAEAKSPEDYRRLMEELWQTLSDTFKDQSESQFREFLKATENWLAMAQRPTA
jgi:hypothetical protein